MAVPFNNMAWVIQIALLGSEPICCPTMRIRDPAPKVAEETSKNHGIVLGTRREIEAVNNTAARTTKAKMWRILQKMMWFRTPGSAWRFNKAPACQWQRGRFNIRCQTIKDYKGAYPQSQASQDLAQSLQTASERTLCAAREVRERRKLILSALEHKSYQESRC